MPPLKVTEAVPLPEQLPQVKTPDVLNVTVSALAETFATAIKTVAAASVSSVLLNPFINSSLKTLSNFSPTVGLISRALRTNTVNPSIGTQ
jgi:hypothetical protein